MLYNPLPLLPDSTIQTTELPTITHAQIEYLYKSGYTISYDQLYEILTLPRQTLIQDLELVIEDGIKRFEFCCDQEWNEDNFCFVFHALFLLSQIEATESLPKILEFLKYEDSFIEFWMGDFLGMYFWQGLYRLSKDQPEVLFQFLMQPNTDTFVKCCVSDTLVQIGVHNQNKRTQVVALFNKLFSAYLSPNVDIAILDSNFISFAFTDCAEGNFLELKEIIKQVYDKGLANPEFTENYEMIKMHFAQGTAYKMPLQDMFSVYDEING